jgi:hypothetical protein
VTEKKENDFEGYDMGGYGRPLKNRNNCWSEEMGNALEAMAVRVRSTGDNRRYFDIEELVDVGWLRQARYKDHISPTNYRKVMWEHTQQRSPERPHRKEREAGYMRRQYAKQREYEEEGVDMEKIKVTCYLALLMMPKELARFFWWRYIDGLTFSQIGRKYRRTRQWAQWQFKRMKQEYMKGI